MKEFTDLLKKKAEEQAKSPVEPSKLEAKASAIKSLMHEMKGLMGNDLKDGLKKVTVASDSKEGLEKGLEKAHDLMGAMPNGEEELGEEEEMESPEFEASEDESAEHGSDEEKKIAELEKQLMELKAKKKA